MKKKFLSMFIILTMIVTVFSSLTMNADAASATNIEYFSEKLFEMRNPNMFMDMVETFHKISDGAFDGFSNRYEAVILALNLMHQADVEDVPDTSEEYIYELVKDFVKHPTVTVDTLSNMRNYLIAKDKIPFATAFAARDITFGNRDDDITKYLIKRGVERLDFVFDYLKANQSLRINIITRSIDG